MQHTKDGQQVEIIETYFPLFGERASDKAVFWAGMTFCGLEKLRAKQNAIAVASYAEAKIIHALTRLQKEVQAKDAAAIRSRGTWDIALKQDFTGEQPSDFLVPVLEKILELVLPEGLLVRRGYRYTSNPEGQP
jgi:hypothetical protein